MLDDAQVEWGVVLPTDTHETQKNGHGVVLLNCTRDIVKCVISFEEGSMYWLGTLLSKQHRLDLPKCEGPLHSCKRCPLDI